MLRPDAPTGNRPALVFSLNLPACAVQAYTGCYGSRRSSNRGDAGLRGASAATIRPTRTGATTRSASRCASTRRWCGLSHPAQGKRAEDCEITFGMARTRQKSKQRKAKQALSRSSETAGTPRPQGRVARAVDEPIAQPSDAGRAEGARAAEAPAMP